MNEDQNISLIDDAALEQVTGGRGFTIDPVAAVGEGFSAAADALKSFGEAVTGALEALPIPKVTVEF